MKINPGILKRRRESLGWSQADLQQKSGVSKRQIQRLEDEQIENDGKQIRTTTINRLARALGVTPMQLGAGQSLPDLPAGQTGGLEDALTSRLDPRTVLNFDLLTAKYGVSIEEVILVAPVLFSIFARRAVTLREGYISKLLEESFQGGEDVSLSFYHEISAPWVDRGDTDASASVIRQEKIFCARDGEVEWFEDQNSFVDALREELTKTDHPPAQLVEHSQCAGLDAMHPGYQVPQTSVLHDELDRVTCLDPAARWALQSGAVRLPDIPEELLQVNRAIDRIKWLRERSPKTESTEGGVE